MEDFCLLSSNKDTLIIKHPKKSPLLLRMVVIMLAMLCGVYICSTCVRQTTSHTMTKFVNIQVITTLCHNYCGEGSEVPLMHYPKPLTFSRAECADSPVRFFAILSLQRSGSGWFETLLNSHVNVSSNGEIFSVKCRRANISMILRTMDKVYNLDWVTSASKNECTTGIGFKWMLNQGLMENHEEIVKYFNTRGVSTILLFRRNLLGRMVSELANSYDRRAKLLNGTHKSHVHSMEEADTLSKYKPTVNSTALLHNLNQAKLTVARALEHFNTTRHIIVYYEDLLKNRSKLVDVQEFLGLPLRDLTSRQVKIHKGPLSEHIKNWDEVNRTLYGTAYQSFLSSED